MTKILHLTLYFYVICFKCIIGKCNCFSGLFNEGFEDEFGKDKAAVDSADDLYTPLHLDDGTILSEYQF